MMSFRGLMFAVSFCCCLYIAMVIAQTSYKTDYPKRLLATGVLFPLIAFASIFIPALFGVLYYYVPTLFLFFFTVIVFLFSKKNQYPECCSEIIRPSGCCRAATMLAGGLLVGLFSGMFLYQGTFFCDDDYSYHSDFIMGLIVNHDASLCSELFAAYYPFNAEYFASFFVVPFHQDGLAGLVGLYWFGLLCAVLVTYCSICSRSGKRAVALGICIFLMTTIIQKNVQSYSAVDIAAPVMMLSATLFLLSAREEPGHRRMDMILGGLCAGFSVGCKVTMGLLGVCLLLAIIWKDRGKGIQKTFQNVGIVLLTMTLAGGFPYVRNLWLIGNPFFPASFLMFEGPFGAEQQHATKLLTWILNDPANHTHWAIIWRGYTYWPLMFFLFSCAGFVLAGKSCFGKTENEDRSIFVKRYLFASGVLLLILYPVIPFSGSPNSPDAPLMLQIRYLLYSYLVGIFFFVSELWKYNRAKMHLPWIVLMCLLLRYGLRPSKIAVSGVVVMACWLVLQFCDRYYERVISFLFCRRTIISATGGFLAGLMVFSPKYQAATNARLYLYQPPMEGLWFALERLIPDNSSICSFGTTYHRYLFWGREFQYQRVLVDLNGQRLQPFHLLWKDRPEEAVFWTKKRIPFMPSSLVDNLKDSNIDYVVTSKHRDGQWPPQHEILNTDIQNALLYEDQTNCLWHIRGKADH